MNRTNFLASMLVAGAILLSGCGKPGPAPVPQGKWDPVKLGLAFQDSPAEVNTVVDQSVQAVRRTEYDKAIAGLDGLLSDARVTAAQKVALSNAIEQIKNKANAAPAPAQ